MNIYVLFQHIAFSKIHLFCFLILDFIYRQRLGVSIFGSVRFSSKKITKPIFYKKKNGNWNRFKPTSFCSVNWREKPEKPVYFFWLFYDFWWGHLKGLKICNRYKKTYIHCLTFLYQNLSQITREISFNLHPSFLKPINSNQNAK
jgi:hypothetical protein